MKRTIIFLFLALAAMLWGETVINGSRSILGTWNAGGAASTIPAKVGTSLPVACAVGEQFFLTTAAPGRNLHTCSILDTWVWVGARGTLTIELFGANVNTAAGELADLVYPLPGDFVGLSLLDVRAQVVTAGTTNVTSAQIIKCPPTTTGNACSGTNVNMLTTAVSVDSGENSSTDAATPPAINASNRLVSAGQLLKFNVTGVSTTVAKGLTLVLTFGVPAS